MPNLKIDLKKGVKLKFDLRMKLIIIGSICFIFIVFWFVIISNYQSGKSSNILSQGEVLKSSYKSKYQYLVDLQDNAKKIDAAQKIEEQAYKKILPISNPESPIDLVTKLGNEEKLKFAFFKPKAPVRYADYQVTPMDISLYGNFDNLIRFMEKLNKADTTIVMDQFVIMRRGADPNDIIMNATLQIYNGLSDADKQAAIDAAAAAKSPPPKVKKNVKK